MIEYYTQFWTNYFNFQGRARRSAYWYAFLMNIIIATVLSVLKTMVPQLSFLYGLYGLAALIPGLSLCVRRLHDTGRSGLWLLAGLLPSVVIEFLILFGGYSAALFIGRHMLIVSLIALIPAIVLLVFFCQDSDHQNYYGPNPKYHYDTEPENAYTVGPQSRPATGSSFYKAAGEQQPSRIFHDEEGITPRPVNSFYKVAEEQQPSKIFHDEEDIAPRPVNSFYKAAGEQQPSKIFHDEEDITPRPVNSFYKGTADGSQSRAIFHDDEN